MLACTSVQCKRPTEPMTDSSDLSCWVFNGNGAAFPSGVFLSREAAHEWIQKHRLSGTLTGYPADRGVYDWAVDRGYFVAKKPEHSTSGFIAGFSFASQPHYHYVDGVTLE